MLMENQNSEQYLVGWIWECLWMRRYAYWMKNSDRTFPFITIAYLDEFTSCSNHSSQMLMVNQHFRPQTFGVNKITGCGFGETDMIVYIRISDDTNDDWFWHQWENLCQYLVFVSVQLYRILFYF